MQDLLSYYYNPLIVIISTLFLGAAGGLIGSFLVLRKETLISDAVTHSTLPGVGLGFLISYGLGLEDGRFLPLLLIFAAITAFIGTHSVRFLIKNTRLSSDTAIAATMSFFYGAGLLLLSYIQSIKGGNKAGLDSFLLGQVAGLTYSDFTLIACISILAIILTTLRFRSLSLQAFDPLYANLINDKNKYIDLYLTFIMVLVVCAGLKTVGIILILALLILPAIAARQLASNCTQMACISATFGALSCIIGVFISFWHETLPTGSTIVMSAFFIFVLCLLFKELRGKYHA